MRPVFVNINGHKRNVKETQAPAVEDYILNYIEIEPNK